MMKYRPLVWVFFSLSLVAFAQERREGELRVKQSAFPKTAYETLAPYFEDAKRIRFYKKFDGEKTSYEARFKKDRLFFNVEFDAVGKLESVAFTIKQVDIPEESYIQMDAHIKEQFERPRLKMIQQQYPLQENNSKQTLRDAFQNMLKPYIRYELTVTERGKKGFQEHALLFDASGRHIGASGAK